MDGPSPPTPSAGASAAPSAEVLSRLIRQSRLLDPIAKRHWRKLLPYLAPADRARLLEILTSDVPESAPG